MQRSVIAREKPIETEASLRGEVKQSTAGHTKAKCGNARHSKAQRIAVPRQVGPGNTAARASCARRISLIAAWSEIREAGDRRELPDLASGHSCRRMWKYRFKRMWQCKCVGAMAGLEPEVAMASVGFDGRMCGHAPRTAVPPLPGRHFRDGPVRKRRPGSSGRSMKAGGLARSGVEAAAHSRAAFRES